MHILHQSVMGGLYVGIGAMLSLSVAGACPGIAESNPGLQKFIFGALFPMNLLLILTTGGQLFTGNVAAVPAAFFEGLVTFPELAKSLAVSYIGNVIGCGLMAYACSYTGLLHYGADKLAIATVVKKMGGTVGQKIVKAIMCNWLVCMAVFLCGAANDMLGKYIGIWLPISAFVTIGLEHSVANMFLLPAGVLSGADYTIAKTFLKNLLPVTFGNAIAGVVLVAAGYSYAFGALGKKKE
jgi:formate/nitrite transporter